ncbi:hypothetical protein SMD44_07257 [Streptomyces alboflavus]|uniref:Uncharacterized protein n=1 Tax=Streptomyces alboflavus TaxID=67267 RepID=A0A1Z1WMU8_9ACTN|nr:hypothetical protein SMD44_07257 [Streptomyces alboflavus]
MSRLTTRAIRPMSVTGDCPFSQASPSSKNPGKFRASENGTYSWGIQSLATPRCRLSSFSTTSSRAYRSRASVHVSVLPRWEGVIVTGAPGDGRGEECGARGEPRHRERRTYGIVGYVPVG